MIKLANVGMVFDRRTVLRDVDFTLFRGDFMAISGPNGGGKTTLLKIMLRLLKPTFGSVKYFDSEGNPVKRLAIGYLPQKNTIDLRFPITVQETVQSGILHGFWGRANSQADRRRFAHIANLCGIEHILNHNISDLSGGQLQRTLLARAIISDPQLLVLDEPLSYVDKHFEHQIYDIMLRLREQMTIVLVSHEMSVISGMANRHIIVDHTIHQCNALHHYIPGECDEH